MAKKSNAVSNLLLSQLKQKHHPFEEEKIILITLLKPFVLLRDFRVGRECAQVCLPEQRGGGGPHSPQGGVPQHTVSFSRFLLLGVLCTDPGEHPGT